MEIKICNTCGEEKPLTEFNFRNRRENKYFSICKECQRKRRRELYKIKYKEEYKDRLRENKKKHRNFIKQKIQQLKSEGCCICGECDPCCLDFHHLRDKEFEIGHSMDVTLENLMKEVDKCIVLCANCHRKIHAGKIVLPN